MLRVISQIVDSTDGEDYEELQKLSKKPNIIEKLNKYNTGYNISCILKEIGNQLLHSTSVRTEYKKIKDNLIPPNNKSEFKRLDSQFGRGFGLIINYYESIHKKISEDAASTYFQINQKLISKACAQEHEYQTLQNDAERGVYYLEKKVDIHNTFKNIHKLHKSIELHAQNARKKIEPFFKLENKDDASIFLAKIRASQKIDRDLGKNHLCDFNHGTGKIISSTSITKKTTQQNETLEVCKRGAFKHLKTNEGTYKTIGEEWNKLIEKQSINEKELKKFFQSSLKGKIMHSFVKDKQLEADLIEQFKADIELIFGIETKRNSASLLTNAMFFDLVDKGIYELKQIASKMPMAMEGAVNASVIIDKDMGKSTYDYRENPRGSKEAKQLLKNDTNILQDWLSLKLDIHNKLDPNDAISILGINSIIRALTNLKLGSIVTDQCDQNKLIRDEEKISFKLSNCSGILQWDWDTAKGQFKANKIQVQKVSAKVFFNLIKDWYGIELSCLNKDDSIVLKAAAEPQDPTLDRDDYQGSFKLPASDTASEGAVSKMKLLDYKQKYVLIYRF